MPAETIEAGSPAELFTRAIEGATNDELLELTYRMLETLADRAENAADIAIDSDDRDIENEALTFAKEADALMPWNPRNGRYESARYKIGDAEKDIETAARNRRARLDGTRSRVEQFSRRRTARLHSAWEVEGRHKAKQREQLVQRADVTAERVMEAIAAATGRQVRAKDIAIALMPRLADTSVGGRQAVINRVSRVLRDLAKAGQLEQIRPESNDDGRKTCRYSVPSEERGGGDAR